MTDNASYDKESLEKYLREIRKVAKSAALGEALSGFQTLEQILSLYIAQIIFPEFPKPKELLVFIDAMEFWPKFRYFEKHMNDKELIKKIREVQSQRNNIVHPDPELVGKLHDEKALLDYQEKLLSVTEELATHLRRDTSENQK